MSKSKKFARLKNNTQFSISFPSSNYKENWTYRYRKNFKLLEFSIFLRIFFFEVSLKFFILLACSDSHTIPNVQQSGIHLPAFFHYLFFTTMLSTHSLLHLKKKSRILNNTVCNGLIELRSQIKVKICPKINNYKLVRCGFLFVYYAIFLLIFGHAFFHIFNFTIKQPQTSIIYAVNKLKGYIPAVVKELITTYNTARIVLKQPSSSKSLLENSNCLLILILYSHSERNDVLFLVSGVERYEDTLQNNDIHYQTKKNNKQFEIET
ncbi:hypothetical protein AGLY_010331 [Aphis glycines]|uniref:Uncharacterized protein n=1 Tax=Aphis glycines TaxID=307491 RepID=A0A6G0TFQ4_APHGL|nr:hypothetical protein AGLY_010331 [Aphis glycines]